MLHYLDVNTIFFSVMGYPMSYIEFFGTILNVWCVWLAARNKVLNWPVGIVAVVLFFALFYQIRLYSDMAEQVWFFVTGFWGWWMWTHPKGQKKAELPVTRSPRAELWYGIGITLAGTIALGTFMSRVHLLFPAMFPAPADYPYLDAFTTVMSFTATVLMMRRRVDCWAYWITVDVIGIWLYFMKDVRFIALEYVLFLGMATWGLLSWRKLLAGGTVTGNVAAYAVSDGIGGR
jgi:nicotinamide mononucleotide transporter